MKTVRYKRTIVAMLMLLMYGAGDVWAQSIDASSIIINVMPSGTEATSSATATEGNVSATVSERVVTLTVTPASGYYIKASDIVVEPLASMGRANAPRRGGVMDLSNEIEGTLYNHETGRTEANVINSVSYQNTAYYVFELPTRYDGAYVTATFTASTGEIRIPNGSSITYNASGHYILENDIAATALEALFTGSQSTAFSGTFEGEAKADGTFPKITGVSHALFDKIIGGTVKNVMLDNVIISNGTNVGAICNEATGNSRIYNCGVLATNSTVGKDDDGYDKITSCSSTISGSGYVGGLVGLLDGSSRVINCFSYADVSGGSEVGGIVGHNNVATTSSNLQTMVMNCMFYGEVSGSSIAPIYNGEIITNDGDANGVNNFNYFRIEASYIQDNSIVKVYNCALGAETRFLQRFEFYRNLLNSNRELAAWWATDYTTNKDDIAKWVLDKAIAPYPILKKHGKYPSIINYDPEYTYDSEDGEIVSRPSYSEENRNKGAKIGTLDVLINNVGSNAPSGARIVTSTLRLVRTDKDYDDYNFNFDKIQLPYYNEVGIGNYTGNKVVTGWKITSITGGTQGSYSTGDDVTYDENGNLTTTPYNFADRKCTDKDLFSVSGRVFNQGAYWDVPEGVTSITIEPYWGKAVYLSDSYWDVTYKNGTGSTANNAGYKDDAMTTAQNVPYVGGGQHYTNGVSTFKGQLVYTSMSNAISSNNTTGLFVDIEGDANNQTVYDYAVVLVGNYHHIGDIEASNSKPYTVTSVDLDGDNEPDYSFMLRFNGRTPFHPVRYDFLNLVGLGMAQKTTGGKGSYNFGIMQPKAWFEVTNTAILRVTQFEYDRNDRGTAPHILQGGVIEQWVSGQSNGVNNQTIYFHVGGNVWFKEFQLGTHIDQTHTSKHPPISVTGGDFNEFYLTGLYRGDVTSYDDNAECYINGGRFGVLAGAGQEGLGSESKHTNGNITWQIDNADITEFYGGGFNQPIQGNITTLISNSHVDQFCGGPKFGDMNTGKTVKTTATNCTFGTYFGAGYGGNAYSREAPSNVNNIVGDYGASNWNKWVGDKYLQAYNETYKGVSTEYTYQYLPMSNNTQNVARIFIDYVRFSLAKTYEVTSQLTGCHISGNFYGGGSLGKVEGTVTSTLTDCSVNGNVFGAGYSAELPTVEVMDLGGFQSAPYYYTDLGTYRSAVFPKTTTYDWKNGDAIGIDKNQHILYTTEDLKALGTVRGKVTLNIQGNTLVKGIVTENNVATQSGGVFGGGDASAAQGDTEVNIDASSQQAEGYNTYNVFGGGNKADVGGSVVVNMKNGVVNNDVYGGGALANTNIGNVTTGYGTDSETIPNTTTKTTTVNLQGGTIRGDAYGGGLGRKASTGVEAVEATVYGDITVNLGDADASVAATAFNISNYTQEGYTSVVKSGRLFGANNLNGSPKGNVTVNIYKTVTGNQSRTAAAAYKKKEGETGYEAPTYEVAAVYGGGNLADYTTTGKKAIVNILTCDISVESVYGGGNAAAVPATEVSVDGAYEIQYVFGGGNGKDPYTLDGGTNWTDNSGANVTGDATTVLTGGFIHEAYGASNEKGRIFGKANLQADDAGNTDDCALDVWKMVGAGKNADFIGNVNLVLGCMPEAKVDAIYGGADNANVFGNVTLTVTSGNFGAVYGGNNLSGIITGQIILNIEETGCRPINIDALYLGGNQAAYSKYGYYVQTEQNTGENATGVGDPNETAILTNGKLTFLPRKAENDSHLAVKTVDGTTWTVYTGEGTDKLTPYADPILNVRSFTHIGEVFGGGYGAGAIMYANPTVNINQTYGSDTELGTIGNVYGGGDAADVEGITTVNIGTETTVGFITEPSYLGTKGESLETAGVAYIENTDGTFETKVQGANITGNVYGGGKLANVKDITNVNIGAKDNGSGYVAVTEGAAGVTIAGNVYGGGKGEAAETGERAFFCEEAMVGVDGMNANKETNDSETYANYGTHVRIGHGTVNGTVYGGGEIGRVEFHTEVTIGYGEGTGSTTKSPVINGYVYGAGKGVATRGYSGLARGDSKVTIQGDAKVGQSVYGGGEKASVGKYQINNVSGLPETPLWGGKCTVTIQGYAEIGPDNMQMVTESGKPDDTGHVFGAGAGILPYENVTGDPYSIQPSGKVTYNENYVPGTDGLGYKDAYLKFIRTLGLASNTEVTIGGHAFVKGSVYGGSENGYVQANTHVTIAGGQVGAGYDETQRKSLGRYEDNQFIDPTTTPVTESNALWECAHWPYESPYKPYDYYDYQTGTTKPKPAGDGHTFYGNVFGGGRGYYPYMQNPDYNEAMKALGYSDGLWIREAGSVAGNTVVDITGGHILTSVYGGNEMTDVTGTCTINMVGGTVGVPRTVAQMQGHPVTCYVFGAGKGDQRVNFHNQTNVASTKVNISGTARIYGSTFGGGEDGHVIGDAETNIGGDVTIGTTTHSYSNVLIGTAGTSSVDGNIFGGGRGFSETALTAGVVGGNVRVNIHNGKMLGSVFGGGRLASVGTYFEEVGSINYGNMQEDDETSTHGHIHITIDGGIIGATDSNGALVESNFSIGDVFGGCKGSSDFKLRYGLTKTTSITMSGGKVNGSVYGGGEIAIVGRNESADLTEGEGNTTINISGGKVGDGVTKKGGAKIGNVFGGGKGSLDSYDAGLIKGNSNITISGTAIIYHNVYGGGAYGSVGVVHRGASYVPGRINNVLYMPTSWTRKTGNTGINTGTAEIKILGGQIGTDGDENGMVFGSSRGDVETPEGATSSDPLGTDVDRNDRTAWVYDTKVVIGESGTTGPDIRGSVYGSGENGHVFNGTDVQIHSGKIGVTESDAFGGADYRLRGNVYGGGCGEDDYTISDVKYYNPLAGIVLGNSKVTIDGGHVVHNVYGAGALGSVGGKATIEISGGQVGVEGSTGGSVFGAARGNLDITQAHIAQVKETKVDIKPNDYNDKPDPVIWNDVFGGGEAGIVTGSVNVSVSGGEVKNDVYGGGALANTNTDNVTEGYGTDSETIPSTSTYTTTVNLTGGLIGNAYGGGLGRQARSAVEAQEAVYFTQQECNEFNATLEGAVTTSDVNPLTSQNYTQEEADAYNATLEGAISVSDIKIPAIEAQDEETEVAALVYGDVEMIIDGTKFHQQPYSEKQMVYYTDKDENDQDKTFTSKITQYGRVFGANNIKGTPKGNILVTVNKTVPEDGGEHEYGHYEIHSVYGGGNLADYLPIDGKNTQVVVDNCGEISIEYVYGGGNSASVPQTLVTVNGCFEIGMIFGGGNGEDPVQNTSGVWVANPGADVKKSDGTAGTGTINAYGGTIRWLYGGSNKKGLCGVISQNLNSTNPECPLKITNVYGAGRNADVQEVFVVAKCPGENIEYIYGGSYNANIKNGITLTLIGGQYKNVYGGNDSGGTIGGPINVNIQESYDCSPIIIDNLYGGGNKAEYPGNNGTGGSITVNVKSCTYIGNIFGAGRGDGAVVNGNVTVNLNMTKGILAGSAQTYTLNWDKMDITKSDEQIIRAIETEIPNILVTSVDKTNKTVECRIKNEIGTIGNVYGGGDEATVNGTTQVNIGTAQTVAIMQHDNNGVPVDNNNQVVFDEDGNLLPGKTYNDIYYLDSDVLGVYINGNVFGGGNLANVTGNTYVNIGAKKVNDTEVWESVPVGSEGLTIAGNVYGGGKGAADNFECDKAMVGTNNNYGANNTGSTYVHIGNGTIGNGTTGGNVYGGGMIGRVEANTNVTVGFGEGVAPGGTPTSAPVIYGSLYGAGQGVATHGYSGLVRGNSTVTIMGNTKLMGSVYGGGQKATVGRFWVKDINNNVPEAPDAPKNTPTEMPYAPMAGGTCTVTIGGYAEIGPDDMVMNNTSTGKPDDLGHVFGAGKGLIPYEDTDTEPGTGEGQGPGRWYKPNGVYTWQSYANRESDYLVFIETFALASNTYVTIRDNAFIKGSVYGGSENGRVLSNTSVTIQDNCQIGNGYVQMDNDGNYLDNPLSMNRPYSAQEWTEGRLYITNADRQELQDLVGSNNYYTNSLPECSSWPYQDPHAPYDRFANASGLYENGKSAEGGRSTGSDGRTFYGNVFGGGSGYYPYKNDEGEIKWHWEAGAVGGNITVVITGGHILTNIYGGNEMTNVGKDVTDTESGKCTIEFRGTATLGVPRTLGQIKDHPVTCDLFGAGKGDQRVFFNKQTNVNDVDVKITGGKIYGSVFGGGEDGHVMRDVAMTIGNENGTGPTIGTWGTSYVDGNVFGGGRGFSGEAQTAGTVGGNVTLNIKGGTMLGSIYGGGRLASVGTMFEFPELDNGDPNPEYGNLKEDDSENKYGHVTVNISGGTIGNSEATGDGAKYSGNVFGGSMGRLDLLDGTTRNPIWPKLAQVKSTAVNISGNAEIIRSVYGGGEFGTVRDNAYVTIGGTRNNDGTITKSGSPTIYRDVYGGGYGSKDMNYTVFNVFEPTVADPSSPGDYELHTYAFSPMQFAGCVGQSTTVNICGGYIWKSVYGGGEMASVGIFNSLVQDVTTKPGDDKVIVEQEGNTKWTIYSNIIKHYDDESTFALSWPYKFEYLDAFPGTTQINITGGRIGAKEGSDANSLIANNEDFGDVYGGGKGIAGDYNDYIFCANVGSTEITIDYTDDENKVTDPSSDATSTGNYITGAVYGGAENGHVMGDTKITLTNGLIGHALYGGGSGKGTYKTSLLKIGKTKENANPEDYYTRKIYSITAGKVFGNTEINMKGGYVVRNVYGGGTYGSVGKGNYAGGTDDYSYYYNDADNTQYNGYGEAIKKELWSDENEFSQAFLHSGICTVNITGGTVGYIKDVNSVKDGLPYGNVFGGCRGESAPNITEKPRYQYTPESFMGYANQTIVTIGTKDQSSENAGQPGKAPRIYGSVYGGGQDGHVRRDATVTIYSGEIGSAYDNTKFNDDIWLHSGNVYGAGSGIGKYKYDFNYDNDYDDNGQDAVHTVQYHSNDIKEEDYSTSAGSVTRYTKVEIQGGKIHRNVYGGGSLASIGAPKYPIERTDGDPESHNEVIISGGQIGSEYSYDAKDNHIYGGNVYGASRGQEGLGVRFSSSVQTNVTISGGLIKGDVYGGGEIGAVKCDVDVNMLGGTIEHSIYGGGALANTNTSNWNPATDNFIDEMVTTSGKITTTYNTKLNLLGGVIGGEAYGGGLGQQGNSQNNQSAVEAFVYGDVILNLNGLDKNDYSDNTIPSSLMSLMSGKVTQIPNSTHEYRVSTTGAIVDQIFGANNLNGTPKGHIKVHVFATQNKNALKPTISDKFVRDEKADSNPTLFNHLADSIIIAKQLTPSAVTSAMEALNANSDADDIKTALAALKTSIDNFVSNSADATIAQNKIDSIRYDVKAVYGGGNLAAYIYGNGEKIENTDANKAKIEAARTEVIIDGCDYTSIKTVYGGGNAASASGTYVEVNSTYEINEVFGGGNGADSYYLIEGDKTVWYENPGANVGYKNYTHVVKDGSKGDGSKDNPYQAIDNTGADTPENRRSNYGYGSGIASTDIRGGTIHYVFGGSNKKGNISTTALSVYSESDDDCPIDIHETYGGGKNAPIDGAIELTLDCVKDMDMIFGGSKNADVNSNITLNITNGRFNKVFGGNNTSGAINGSITVNIEEKGCVPIEIDELYGGGYLAPYSIYGYEKDADGNYNVESVPYIDNNTVNYLNQRIPLTSGDTQNNDPRINIISATRIGTVYGGGYQAKVVGSPYVNVNMTNGKVEVKNTADSGDPVYKDGNSTEYTVVMQDTDNGKYYATLEIGTIDTIFGGGNLADIVGDTHVEIGTGRWVTSWDANGNPIYETVDDNGDKYYYKVETAAVTYGSDECTEQNAALPGAITTSTELTAEQATRLNELLSLSGDDAYTENGSPTQEHAEAYNATLDGYITTADVKTPAAWAWYGSDDNKLDDQTQPTPARYAANITGDVFGGGKGKADNFTCDKAMIGIENEAADPAKRNGGTNVIIANGTVGGSVYGGGMIGRVEKNTAVTIGFESGTGEPVIEKDVFGAGMGIDTHGYAGLVRGNSSVIIQGKSKVRGSVYGGGMQASLGRYFIATTPDLATAHNVEPGMPYDLKSGGKATVTVQGSAEIGPDDMLMTAAGGPRNTGHVFGAGKGTVPYSTDNPGRYTMSGWESYSGDDKEAAYIKYIETLGITNETEVTVGDSAFIKGSVYGGGENGFVLKNTHVTIQDNCQIGNGLVQMADNGTYLTNPLSMNRPYSKEEWTKGKLIMTAADRQELRTLVGNSNYTSSLPECSSWPYQAPYAPYDKFADADGNYPSGSAESTARGGRSTGSDGHTFYGNVFGGGSGYYPYKPGKWHDRAGSVGGNTVVEITGGHILTSVYGGNELTNVDGSATVTMKGGTLGVPRTLGQIAAHPITCYLFGAGKGDMRTFFNTENNVASALVTVSDSARIYGSVFGGGEDGHVLGDVTLNISDTAKIGTTGTSYVDGNVFGAGRGFNGEAITAGSVGGNIVVYISGGTMLGSVYGGGRLASVGIGFNAVTDADYGQFTDDTDSRTYGHITVNISGGTIGNDLENQSFAVDVDTNGKTAQEVETAKNNGLKALKDANKIPNTDFELYDSLLVEGSTAEYKYLYRTVHTKGGNVYGGSMGRLTLLDNSFNPVWPQLGQAKSTTVNITGGTIKSNVYGGGEIGSVRDNTYVTISGSPTIYRDVYGGGYGSTIDSEDSKAVVESTIKFGYTPLQWAGIVGIGTEVNIYGGWVKKSVYGGGEMASVGIINYVLDETEYATEADVPAGKVIFRKNPVTQNYTVYANIVKHTDESNSFALSWPYKFEYIPQYTGTAKVNIRGGRIGITGKDFMGPFAADGVTAISPIDGHTLTDAEKKAARIDNGDVFGGGKGMAGDRYEMAFLSNVGSSEVTIDYPAGNEATPQNYKNNVNGTYTYDCITGSVYAGAENGHVMGNTQLTLNNGLIGHAIYGGGKGKGTYMQKIVKIGSSDYTNVSIYSITAGKVYGNTKVDMTGGYVVRNVYGGGNMGSVGKGNYAGGIDDYSSTGYGEVLNGNLWDGESLNSQAFLNSGKTEVTITGGSIGYYKENDAEDSMKDGLPYGNVFGGCRGESAPNIRESPRYHYSPQFYSGYTNETKVTIGTEGSTAGPTILGSVYGGGQDGHVRRDASVTIYSGEIGIAYGPNVLKYKNNQGITDLNNAVWLHRGNVYGAGSGIGKYQYDFNYDGDFDDDDATYNGKRIKEQDYSTSAGSVTRFTNVEINGGTIHRNVYGGGSLASVGAPKIPPTRTDVPYIKGDTVTGHGVGRQSLNEVIINGGTIGDTNSRTVGYGGNVYGASRGLTELGSGFATSVWTKVEANSGHIYGNVFGGGEAGSVTMDSKVIIGGKVENTNSGSGAPRRTTPAVQPDAAAPANTNSSSNSSTVTPANVATEAPDARSIRINRAQ